MATACHGVAALADGVACATPVVGRAVAGLLPEHHTGVGALLPGADAGPPNRGAVVRAAALVLIGEMRDQNLALCPHISPRYQVQHSSEQGSERTAADGCRAEILVRIQVWKAPLVASRMVDHLIAVKVKDVDADVGAGRVNRARQAVVASSKG